MLQEGGHHARFLRERRNPMPRSMRLLARYSLAGALLLLLVSGLFWLAVPGAQAGGAGGRRAGALPAKGAAAQSTLQPTAQAQPQATPTDPAAYANANDPATALLILAGVVLAGAAIILLTIGIISGRAGERAETQGRGQPVDAPKPAGGELTDGRAGPLSAE